MIDEFCCNLSLYQNRSVVSKQVGNYLTRDLEVADLLIMEQKTRPSYAGEAHKI